ncbi:MAG: hypothetical protein APR53_01155 [Methanoculleus sp. SDB]|nr:MAG: hypothetical protein APR53_01155 [Methanoculleus sp. SDB]
MNFEQAAAVIIWLIVLKLLQAGLWPLLTETFRGRAAAVAWPLSLLLFTIVSWYSALAGIPLHAALLPFCACVLYAGARGWYTPERIRRALRWDGAFLLGFIFMLEVRFFNPSISFAEKFMDHAFLASIMRSPVVAPADPWFAGGALDMYYYLGHWMAGAVGVVTGIPSSVVFNLILPTVFGMAAVALYATGDLLLPRFRWLPAMALVIPNPMFVFLILTGNDAPAVMWGSTRVIEATINEFPLFSFLWGDPHAHVISLFNQALFIFLLAFAYKRWGDLARRDRVVLCACAALSLGSMPLLNSWDILAYAPLTLLAGGLILRRYGAASDGWMFAAAVPLCAIACYLPYYLMLQPGSISGIGCVPVPSDPAAFFMVNGIFLGYFLITCIPGIVRRPLLLVPAAALSIAGYAAAAITAVPFSCLLAKKPEKPAELLAAGGLGILILIELLYLADNMGPAYLRMNTVFKLSLVAWMLLGTGTLLSLAEWLGTSSLNARIPRNAGQSALVLLVGAIIVLPAAMPDLDYGYGSRTLDGFAWLETAHPGDASAIRYLRSLPPGDILVEAVGDDYTYFSRISSATGIPAVLGMPFHEQMWRGDGAAVARRIADVQTIYEQPGATMSLMRTYGANLLYVGELEREKYSVLIPVDALERVYDTEGVQIYRIPAETAPDSPDT